MAQQTIEERVAHLESEMSLLRDKRKMPKEAPNEKRGWRWFVGVFADAPDFDEVVRVGQEWRNADRPNDESTNGNEVARALRP